MKQTDWKNKRQSPAENNSIVANELRLDSYYIRICCKKKSCKLRLMKSIKVELNQWHQRSHTQSGDLTTESLWWSRFLKGQFSLDTDTGYTGAGHIIRISSKSWFISVIPFKKWKLYNVYIHSTQTDIFQVFIAFNFYDYNWQLMKTPNSVSQKIRILWKGSILKTPGATL